MQENVTAGSAQGIGEKLEAVKLAGEIALESGAELPLVQEIMTRVSTGLGLENMDCMIFPNGFFITCTSGPDSIHTTLKRAGSSGNDLNRIDQVNSFSFEVEQGSLSVSDTRAELEKIKNAKPFPSPFVCAVGAGLASAGCLMMLQGRPLDILISAVMAFVVWLILPLLNRIGIRGGAETMAASFLLAMFITLGSHFIGIGDTSVIIPGALMLLVPGMTMTTAVIEIVRGDVLNGITKGLEAVLTAVFILAGAFMAVAIGKLIF